MMYLQEVIVEFGKLLSDTVIKYEKNNFLCNLFLWGAGFTQDVCISLDSDNLEKIKNLSLMICSKNNRNGVKNEWFCEVDNKASMKDHPRPW